MKNILFILVFSILATSCLKTRTQIKSDESEASTKTHQDQQQSANEEMRGEISKTQSRLDELDKNLTNNKEDYSKLEKRINELEQAQLSMLEKMKTPEKQIPQENGDLFEKGKKEYTASDYSSAIKSFTEYLKNPNSKMSEESYFLRGESYFQQKNFKKAIVDFSQFPEKYTKSARMPLALYRIGESFDALNMNTDAQAFYQELQDKFPDSKEAKMLSKKSKQKSKKKKK
jgi:tol-pal system protein YbgF